MLSTPSYLAFAEKSTSGILARKWTKVPLERIGSTGGMSETLSFCVAVADFVESGLRRSDALRSFKNKVFRRIAEDTHKKTVSARTIFLTGFF